MELSPVCNIIDWRGNGCNEREGFATASWSYMPNYFILLLITYVKDCKLSHSWICTISLNIFHEFWCKSQARIQCECSFPPLFLSLHLAPPLAVCCGRILSPFSEAHYFSLVSAPAILVASVPSASVQSFSIGHIYQASVSSAMAEDRESQVYVAKLAEQAERYDGKYKNIWRFPWDWVACSSVL